MKTAWALSLATLLLLPCAVDAATPIERQIRPLNPEGQLSIENLKGRIEVRAWERPEVAIEGTLGEGVEKLEIAGDADHLSVHVKYPHRGSGFLLGGDNSEPSELKIMVPLRARLDIESVSADIDVSGVASEELSIESVSGDVQVAGAPRLADIESVSGDQTLTLHRASVTAESVSGDIRLRGRLGEDISVESVSGRVDIDVQEAPTVRLNGSSVSGDLRIGTQLAPKAKVQLESVSGQIELRLPRAVSARLQMETFSGDLSAPSAAVVRNRRGPGARIEHRYAGGDAEISIETFSGDARIRLE